LRYRVNAIVGSFEPKRSQSPEKRLKSTLVLAALRQARRREATTSRQNNDVGFGLEVVAFASC
jgi:hypothetical protein